VIAYEPVWAIGTGLVATPLQAQEVLHILHTIIAYTYYHIIHDNILPTWHTHTTCFMLHATRYIL
jgi:Triosephosphate isomerase